MPDSAYMSTEVDYSIAGTGGVSNTYSLSKAVCFLFKYPHGEFLSAPGFRELKIILSKTFKLWKHMHIKPILIVNKYGKIIF